MRKVWESEKVLEGMVLEGMDHIEGRVLEEKALVGTVL